MADYTYGQLVVHDLDVEKWPDEAAAILEFIDEQGLVFEHNEGERVPDDVLQVGAHGGYSAEEVRVGGFAYDLKELVEKAPHATFEGYEAPKYEWLGDLVRYRPGLGVFTSNCDSEGEPVWGTGEIRRFVTNVRTGVWTIDDLDRALGDPWLRYDEEGSS